MSKELHLGRGVAFPAEDFIETKHAILGKSGGGKSGLTKVIVEECLEGHVPIVVVDPVGVHWGVKSSFDGKKPAFKVLVLGGEHGDLPINRNVGADVARVIVEKNASTVIDLTGMKKSEWRQFCTDFFDELFRINKMPRLVILEECKEFVPQMIGPAVSGLYEAASRGILQGRNRGLGWLLVGQRPASVNKEVLSQIDMLFMFGSISPQDRKALGEWVEAWGVEEKFEEFTSKLATLEERQCWVWSPAKFKVFKAMKTREFTTFHPDRTHLRRHGMLDVQPVAADIEGAKEMLQGALKVLAEEKADQARVPQLRAELARLKAKYEELERKASEFSVKRGVQAAGDQQKAVERAVREATDKVKKEAESREKNLIATIKALGRVAVEVQSVTDKWLPGLQGSLEKMKQQVVDLTQVAQAPRDWAKVEVPTSLPTHQPTKPPTHQPIKPSTHIPAAGLHRNTAAPQPDDTTEPSTDVGIGAAHRKLLRAIVQLNVLGIEAPSRVQVAVFSGFNVRGGTFRTYLSRLSASQMIEYTKGGVRITENGKMEAGDVPPPPTQDELERLVEDVIGESRMKLLKAAMDVYPNALSREELAEKSGYTMQGGTFRTYLSRLSALELVEYVDEGVKASPIVFVEGGG